MTAVYRTIVQRTLEGMEPGRFQDFCLVFLPFYDARFDGLERNGHTVEGKSRPGKPDLIKVTPLGEIGVECGTEEGYWNRPKRIEKWKPYQDLVGCISGLCLPNPIELVAISNREIPPSAANLRSDLLQLISTHTTATITLIHGERISHHLWLNLSRPEVQGILKEFFHEVWEATRSCHDAEQLRTLLASRWISDGGSAAKIVSIGNEDRRMRPSDQTLGYEQTPEITNLDVKATAADRNSTDARLVAWEAETFRSRIQDLLGILEFNAAAELGNTLAVWLATNGAQLPVVTIRALFGLLAQVALGQASQVSDESSKQHYLDRAQGFLNRTRDVPST